MLGATVKLQKHSIWIYALCMNGTNQIIACRGVPIATNSNWMEWKSIAVNWRFWVHQMKFYWLIFKCIYRRNVHMCGQCMHMVELTIVCNTIYAANERKSARFYMCVGSNSRKNWWAQMPKPKPISLVWCVCIVIDFCWGALFIKIISILMIPIPKCVAFFPIHLYCIVATGTLLPLHPLIFFCIHFLYILYLRCTQ